MHLCILCFMIYMNIWIYVSRYGLQDVSMDYMYLGVDYRMELWIKCIQVWITGWTYGSMYPGIDYRMDLWIHVSRYELQD